MSETHTYIRTKVDVRLKEECERVFHQLGLTTAEAIRIFLSQVKIRRGLPFRIELYPQTEENDDLLLPNEIRQAAIETIYED